MFILNRNDTAPLYKQLYNQIREHALPGKLSANSKLQSVRDLAAELPTSRNTVEGACLELHAEGYIYHLIAYGQVQKVKISLLKPDKWGSEILTVSVSYVNLLWNQQVGKEG